MEYLKLLIADDEENIRNGLKCILDWEELGYKVCGEASNGKDSIQQIQDLAPDLIIQDIKMPGYNGIEVISNIKEHCKKNNIPMPAFIILSGFSEFDYAQKALNLGAKAYLLKPVDEDELLEKVQKITQEINQSRKIKDSAENTSIYETKEILGSMLQTSKLPELSKIQGLPFFEKAEESSFQVIICNLDFCRNLKLDNFEKSIESYFSFFSKVVIHHGNKIFIILKTSNEQAVQNSITRITSLQLEKTFITLGKNALGLEGLVESYKNAKELEKYLFFYSSKSYISNNEINDFNVQLDKDKINKIIDSMVFCIETYDKKTLNELKIQLKEMTFNINETAETIKKTFIYCLVELRYRLVSKYPERDISDGDTFDVVKNLMDYKTFDDIFISFCKILDNFLENFNFNTSDSIIIKVISYIKTNYASDLKLETLGEMFNCNSAYLGKKFKKYTGLQFNAYLDNIRMEVAKEKLTNTDLKIYQISKIVGFSNTDYFFMKFKKYTGLTPKEFKKQVENEKNK